MVNIKDLDKINELNNELKEFQYHLKCIETLEEIEIPVTVYTDIDPIYINDDDREFETIKESLKSITIKKINTLNEKLHKLGLDIE